MPLLIQSLDCEDTSIAMSTLQTFAAINKDVFRDHVPSLVPRFLSLARTSKQLTIRIGALQCLHKLSLLPVHTVYPYRRKITNELKPCLDDKKRLVRREAVTCRNAWFMMAEHA